MPVVEVHPPPSPPPDQAVAICGEVGHIVDDLGGGRLAIYIQDLVVVDADP
jgi:hypothetical protein